MSNDFQGLKTLEFSVYDKDGSLVLVLTCPLSYRNGNYQWPRQSRWKKNEPKDIDQYLED